jgi:flagellar biogenesis protein FliO
MFWDMMGVFLAFAIVLLLCYLTTRFVGNKFRVKSKHKNMKIIETLPLGLDRCLYIIRVGKKDFLFYSSKKGIELVSEVELEKQPEDQTEDNEQPQKMFDFKGIFERYSGLSQNKSERRVQEQAAESYNRKQTGIIGSIARLKKMNNHSQQP